MQFQGRRLHLLSPITLLISAKLIPGLSALTWRNNTNSKAG
jgi:hypothetical protein